MKRTLKTFFRSLQKKKKLSVITVGGHALGMSVLVILTAFIIGEKSVDLGFENGKNIKKCPFKVI